MGWKKISSKTVYKNHWMEVVEDEVEIPELGYRGKYGVVKKEDAVGIIPWDGKYTCLVGQFRYPVKLYSWEFCAGHFESKRHKDVIEAAKEELRDEAGLIADKLIEIGEYYIAPGSFTQKGHVYLATGLKKTRRHPDPDEVDMQIKKVTLGEVEKMVAKGQIKDGPTIVMLYFLKKYLETNSVKS